MPMCIPVQFTGDAIVFDVLVVGAVGERFAAPMSPAPCAQRIGHGDIRAVAAEVGDPLHPPRAVVDGRAGNAGSSGW